MAEQKKMKDNGCTNEIKTKCHCNGIGFVLFSIGLKLVQYIVFNNRIKYIFHNLTESHNLKGLSQRL